MIRKAVTYILLVGAVLMASCSNTKHLPAGDSLFTGGKINLKDKTVGKRTRKVLVEDMENAVRPRPNSSFLGIPFKLTLYNLGGSTTKKKGVKAWFHKIGEPPVLGSKVDMAFNKAVLENMLQNRGFFYPSVKPTLVVKHKRSKAVFDVTTGPQYTIRKVFFERDSSNVSKEIFNSKDHTLLDSGQSYNLTLVKAERDRIDKFLKEEGYYSFKSDYILVRADTGVGNHQVDLYVNLKFDEMPQEGYTAYTIDNVYVYPNYRLDGAAEDTSKEVAVEYKTYKIVDPEHKFNPRIFPENLEFAKGDIYNRTDQNVSLSRLINLGVFKYVKNSFRESPVSDTMLDVYYFLTPFPKYSIRFVVGGLTQNDNRAGSQVSVSWLDKNTFKGAELLQFKVNGGFEAQYSGAVSRPNIYNFGAEADLSFPRFEVPFFNIGSYSSYTPKTILKALYNYEFQSNLLRITSYTAAYGYDWKESSRKEHQLYPFNLTYVKTDTLGDPSRLSLLYGNLVFNGIILGPTYEFTYNSQSGPLKTNNFYFDGLIDFSGNILGIAQKADYRSNPQSLFGAQYAQYMKIQSDFRYYLKLTSATTLASRLFTGVGHPYGNSFQLPNIKQYFSGGNSSLRGFPSRLVGPGTFNESNTSGTNHYIETLGDMKLEFSTEVRTNIYKFINGAIFYDAGNIWLYNDNPLFPGGKFTSNFYKELAVDIGAGLRFDFKILILRLDLGIPIREPWLPENNRWVINQINFGSSSWRKQNMILNIAIGYPF
ncbi:MAG: BamA/TamA family outer membrane protein [Taibaiella sp.]|nr:BamA/TamA family outer membrane protein [Taibaiella sp.]